MLKLGDVKRSNRSFDIQIGFFVHIIHHVSGNSAVWQLRPSAGVPEAAFPELIVMDRTDGLWAKMKSSTDTPSAFESQGIANLSIHGLAGTGGYLACSFKSPAAGKVHAVMFKHPGLSFLWALWEVAL
jgi:hypothetical protein